ncbi:MAG: sialidase family protein [Verrucomicrobiota bacterium]
MLFFCFAVSHTHGAHLELIPAEFRGAIQPQAAMEPDGRVHVVFGKGTAIYHVSAADNTAAFSAPLKIAGLPKLALGMRRGPRIVAGSHHLIVSAISHDDGNLHAWISPDHGASWKALSARVNDVPNAAREGLHAMASDGKGFVAIAWLDLRNGAMEVQSAVSHDDGVTWGANVRVYQSPDGHVCECCHPSIAIHSRGEIAVMFRNWLGGSRDMYLALSNDRGATFAPAQKLGSGTWPLKGCPMDGGALAFDASGQPVTVWRREKAVFLSDIRSGKHLAEPALQPILIATGEALIPLWEEGGALMMEQESGKPVRFAANAAFASAASAPGHAPVILWESTVSGNKTLMAGRLPGVPSP